MQTTEKHQTIKINNNKKKKKLSYFKLFNLHAKLRFKNAFCTNSLYRIHDMLYFFYYKCSKHTIQFFFYFN